MSNTLELVQSPMSKVQSPFLGLEVKSSGQSLNISPKLGSPLAAGALSLLHWTLDIGLWTRPHPVAEPRSPVAYVIYFERSSLKYRKVHLEAVGR